MNISLIGMSGAGDERVPLYENFAHEVVSLDGVDLDEAIHRVVNAARG